MKPKTVAALSAGDSLVIPSKEHGRSGEWRGLRLREVRRVKKLRREGAQCTWPERFLGAVPGGFVASRNDLNPRGGCGPVETLV